MHSELQSIYPEIDALCDQIQELQDEIERLSEEALPPGTQVTFRFGNMRVCHAAEVVRTSGWRYPRVQIRNLITGRERQIPLYAIKGVEEQRNQP